MRSIFSFWSFASARWPRSFRPRVSAVTEAVFITLAFRPKSGGFFVGMMADRFGRRVTLMVDIIAYSVFELASAFAPSLKVFIVTRALFGNCHAWAGSGEWGRRWRS